LIGVDPPSDPSVERPTISDETAASEKGKDFWAWLSSKLDSVKEWFSEIGVRSADA